MVEVMVFEGRGKRFVDQLTRIFERQLFFRNLYQSFQPRNKNADHPLQCGIILLRSQPYF